MSKACIRILFQCAVMLCVAAPLKGVLPAQEAFGATARISARPLPSGVDSGKVILAVKMTGIPETGLRFLSREKVVVVDERGRSYTYVGIATGRSTAPATSLVATYLQPAPENLADRQYLFFVAPGSRTFELQVGTLKPIRVTPLADPR
jgi:hypothetical protein